MMSLHTSKVARLLRLLRLTPFDPLTREGRSQERNRRIVLATASSGIARMVSLAVTLITIPLTVRYLGSDRFGLWATLTSLIALLTFVDLGMGNGLLNALAAADGEDDRDAAREYVSGSFFTLLGLAVVLAAAFAVVYPHIRWDALFNVSTPVARAEAGPAAAVFIGCFLATLPLGLAQKVYMGYQDSFVASMWTGGGGLVGLLGVVIAMSVGAGLPWLLLAVAGGPVLASLFGCLHLFAFQRPWLRPRIASVTAKALRRVMGSGTMFLVLGIAGTIGFYADNLVIAQMLGADEVTQYAVPMKVFFFVPIMLGLVLAPLWPAYREALTRGEVDWVQRTFKRSIKLGVAVVALPTLALMLIGRDVIQLWAGAEIQPSLNLLLGLGLWAMVFSISLPVAMLLNGMNAVKFQIVCATAMALTNIGLSIVLVRLIGISGAVYGSAIAQFCFVLIPSFFYLRRFLGSPGRVTSEDRHGADVFRLKSPWDVTSTGAMAGETPR